MHFEHVVELHVREIVLLDKKQAKRWSAWENQLYNAHVLMLLK